MKDPNEPAPDEDEDAAPDDPEDDARIAALIGRIRTADDPTAALLRPLSAEERGRMADQVLASLGTPARAEPSLGTPARAEPRAEPSLGTPARAEPSLGAPARAEPRARSPVLRRIAWILPLAAAFALTLWAATSRDGPALVAYRVEVEGDAVQRGEPPPAPDAAVKLRPETKLRVRLAPAEPTRDVALRLVVVREGKATVISPPAMADGQGGFTIEEAAGKLLGAQVDGPVELVFALGHPLPDDGTLAHLALDRAARVPASVRLERRAAVLAGFSPKLGALGFSGCKAVRAGPVCEVGADTPVHVWAEGADPGRFTLRVDGRAVEAAAVAVEGGQRWSVRPDEGARALSLALAGREVLRVALEKAAAAPLVDEAEALRREGKLDEAEARLDRAAGDPAARVPALRVRAKIARRRGDAARAAALRDEAIAADRAAGRVSDAIDGEAARVFDLLYQDRALAEARQRIDGVAPVDPGDGDDRVKLDYYRGLVAAELGDLRGAIASLRAARSGARRFAAATYETAVAAPLADLLAGLGRHDEAAAILVEMERGLAGYDRCDRAHLVMDHGAVLLRAGRLDAAGARLEEAARLAEAGCPRVLGDVLTNLAFVRREAGATAEAKALLTRARAANEGRGAWMDVWQERLAIELSLDGDPRAALAAAERVRRAGEAGLSAELLFEAAFGRARALDHLGDVAGATATFAAAEDALDAWGALVPLGEGRQAFLDRQERATRARIDFLLREASRRDDPEAALALARAARRSVGRFARLLGEADRKGSADDGQARAVAAYRAARARIDASLAGGKKPEALDLASVRAMAAPSLDEPAPREGELLLVFHPLLDGWLGLAWTAAGVIFRRLGRVDRDAGPAALGAALLSPFRELVARASAIRVYAHRALDAVAFHALPFEGGVLLDRAPVSRGVDLPAPRAQADRCEGAPAALVVDDARENLPAGGEAAAHVGEALHARGYVVRRLHGADARVEAVRRALADPCVRLFHYEGHAVFQGRDGVEASLLLADGKLTAAEILALPRVPELLVLSGCSTGEADGLGLAQAFLAQGAAEVLATAAPVDDVIAARVARRLYEPAAPPLTSLAGAAQAALTSLRREGAPGEELSVYRLLRR
ncbi:MAG: CHAT domain-containing protein [Minicystis sp.]